MRLFTRSVAGVLVLFGIIGLLFGLEISDIERGQTQAICGAVVLVGGVLTYLVSEVMVRLDALLSAVTAGQPQTWAEAREDARPHREAIAPSSSLPTTDTASSETDERQPLWAQHAQSAPIAAPGEAQAGVPAGAPARAAPSRPAPVATTDHVDAAMAAVAAALGTAEEEEVPAPAAPAPAAQPPRRPSLFERARAERTPAPRQEPPAPANPFTSTRSFGSADPFAPPAAGAQPPESPVLNLRPSLAADPTPAPEQPAPERAAPERPRKSLRALAASRSRDETLSAADAPMPSVADTAERAPEKPVVKPPEKPPLPRDIFHRTIARGDETGSADVRLRERLAALRGDIVPAPEPVSPPAPTPVAAAAPRPMPVNPSEEVVGRYESNGSTYVMFADGTIEAETETGVFRFGSLNELKAYLEGGGK